MLNRQTDSAPALDPEQEGARTGIAGPVIQRSGDAAGANLLALCGLF